MGRNLINAESISKSYGTRTLLERVSIGFSQGERIGILGRNGAGKSTLLRIMLGHEPPDLGRVSRTSGVVVGELSQGDELPPGETVREVVLGGQATHQWASDGAIRDIFIGLFGGFNDEILDRSVQRLSGGERRRVALAQLLITDLDLLVLDEPTNHLDVEAVAWLAAHLKNRGNLAVALVTHDRWFLDEICDRVWEVVDGSVEEYEGGYSAFVLAKAERQRQAAAEDSRRANLIRKELAWLRRGAPARTSKPKFRVEAANMLIESEPAPRDSQSLLAFAGNRLGKTVLEVHDISVDVGERRLIDHLTWNIGPGDRIGIVGVNGAGKTTLMNVLAGERRVAIGKVVRGITVQIAYLSQDLEELDPTWRVLEAVERVASRVELGQGRELSASQLCERLGFGADSQWTPVGELSGGERRRLQLTRLLMEGPNVLLLDEPTNDLDIETLTSLEDLLDSFAGTIVTISHDRYFLERVCDRFLGILGDGAAQDLPRGVEQYLEMRRNLPATQQQTGATDRVSSAAEERIARKEMQKLEKKLRRIDEELSSVHDALALASTDFAVITSLTERMHVLEAEKAEVEEQWLAAASVVDG
jgi:ABC transport system ATP-binding/permease protein